METERTYSIKALAVLNGWTIPELAKNAEIGAQRLYDISCGRSSLTGAELIKLAKVAGVKPEEIKA